MSPARFSILLALVELSERDVARLTGYSPSAVRNWSSGAAQVWPPLAAWLEQHAAHWRENPPPRRPRMPRRDAVAAMDLSPKHAAEARRLLRKDGAS